MKFTLVKKQPVAKNIIMFWWKPEYPVRQIAGQYTELNLPHPHPDDRKAKRWFTLSNSPTEELLAITTKFAEKRSSTFKKALKGLKPGDEISGHVPMGDFVLPKDKNLPLIFVAGGIGITPYRSMLKYLVDKKETRDITLIYAVKDQDEIAFEEILKEGANSLIKHFGKLTAEDVLKYSGVRKNQIIYLSGPEKMVETLQKELIAKGIDNTRIRTDFFHNYD